MPDYLLLEDGDRLLLEDGGGLLLLESSRPLGAAEQAYPVPALARVYAVAPLDRRAFRVPALARRYRVPQEDCPVNVGFHTRSAGDDYPLEIDFTAVDVFQADGDQITEAAVTSSPAGLTVDADADVSTENVARFNVSGGSAGKTYTVVVTAENAAGRQVRRELTVHTEG